MHTNKLSKRAFGQTFQAPMQDISSTAEQVLDIWPYVEEIPIKELNGFTVADVVYVFLNSSQVFEHVLIGTEDKNVFLVIVINLGTVQIHGHHLLNLVELYSLAEEVA